MENYIKKRKDFMLKIPKYAQKIRDSESLAQVNSNSNRPQNIDNKPVKGLVLSLSSQSVSFSFSPFFFYFWY
jgi:hypothetical protein